MSRSRAVLGAFAVVVIAGLLLWGAGSGEPLISAPRVDLPDPPTLPDDAAATLESLPSAQAADPSPDNDGGRINAALIAQVVLAGLIAWLVLRWFRNREPDEPADFVDNPPSDQLEFLVRATADASGPRGGYPYAEPRNAVVACWVALENALAGTGEAPKAGETSFDLTQRVMDRWQVDPEPLRRLAALFREARFSRHPITTEHAAAARSALEQIHTGLAGAAARRDRDDNSSAGMS